MVIDFLAVTQFDSRAGEASRRLGSLLLICLTLCSLMLAMLCLPVLGRKANNNTPVAEPP